MGATRQTLVLLVALAAGCSSEPPPLTATPLSHAPNQDFCAGEDALLLDGSQSSATYLCSLEGFDDATGWASIDAHYQEPQPNTVQWLSYVLGLSVNIRSVPRDTPLDVTARPDLVRELHVTTVNAMGDSSVIASYSSTVTFAGSMTVGTGTAPTLSLCIASEVGVASSTRRARVWMRAEAICK